jgi:thymidylate synthase (FAD)
VRIIEPSFSLHTQSGPLTEEKGIELLRWIEYNGRISHRSEDKQSEDSWKRFIPAVVLDHGDWSIVEHATATVILRIDRGCTHELVRHRLFSFTQESTRFCNYQKVGEIDVIKPEGLSTELDTPWLEGVSKACLSYTQMMERKASPQLARSVLPNALVRLSVLQGI